MFSKILKVDNLKCGGCANTVTKSLQNIDGVSNVEVLHETDTIKFDYVSDTVYTQVLKKLAQLGYPEQGTSNLVQKAKSYVSCAIGRLDTTN